MAVIDGGNSTAGKANVDSNYNLDVNLPQTVNQAGFADLSVEYDSGVITGTRTNMKIKSCDDGSIHVGQFTRLFTEGFPGSTINSTLWTVPVTTMTIVQSGNFLVLNSGASTASGGVARASTYRGFQIDFSYHIEIEMLVQFAVVPQANNVCEWGFGFASGTSAPTDGAFFRLNSAGNFLCVVSNNGVETVSSNLNFTTTVGANITKEFFIIFNDGTVIFKIGDDFAAVIANPVAAGTPTSSQNLPVFFRTYNTAVTSAAQVMKIGAVSVRMDMTNPTKPWDDILVGGGAHSSQGQTGQTLGTLAQYANSANPTAAVPTNTTAALGSGLGGQFWETDTLAVTTDGIISSFQVPLGSATAPGKLLYINGIGISSFVQTVLVGGPYVANWSLAYGHNAVSLATTESVTSKAPRRFVLPYTQAVTAAQAVSTKVGTDFYMALKTPIVVYPGEFIQLVKKKVGTAPTGGVIAHLITFSGYWE